MSGDISNPPDHTSGPWSGGFAVVVTILAFVGSAVLASFIMPTLPYLLGWSDGKGEAWLHHSVSAQFVFVMLIEAITLGMLWLFLRRRSGGVRKQLGIDRRPLSKDIAWAIGGFVVYFGAYVVLATILSSVTPLDTGQKQELGFDDANTIGAAALAMTFISLVVLPPFVEELVFRGFLFGGLRRSLPLWPAIILTSTFFAAPHLLQSSEGILWIIGLDTFALSVVLCWLRLKTGSIWAGIGVHVIKNGLAFLTLFIFSRH